MTVGDSRRIRVVDTKIARSKNLHVISSDLRIERASIFTEPSSYPLLAVDGESSTTWETRESIPFRARLPQSF